MFEVANTSQAERVLENAARVRTRFEQILKA
jgi:hypothetical protein